MQKGTLKKWNDAKGFGFILPENGGEDVFFHISFLQASERRPIIGDVVYFDVALDDQGRKRAVNVNIEGMKSVFAERTIRNREVKTQPKPKPSPKPTAGYPQSRPRVANNHRGISKLFTFFMILAVAFFTFKNYERNRHAESSLPSPTLLEPAPKTNNPTIATQYQCAGKTRCGQMASCEEAMFYLHNCPGSVTDGDGDGLPCEDQWCGH